MTRARSRWACSRAWAARAADHQQRHADAHHQRGQGGEDDRGAGGGIGLEHALGALACLRIAQRPQPVELGEESVLGGDGLVHQQAAGLVELLRQDQVGHLLLQRTDPGGQRALALDEAPLLGRERTGEQRLARLGVGAGLLRQPQPLRVPREGVLQQQHLLQRESALAGGRAHLGDERGFDTVVVDHELELLMEPVQSRQRQARHHQQHEQHAGEAQHQRGVGAQQGLGGGVGRIGASVAATGQHALDPGFR